MMSILFLGIALIHVVFCVIGFRLFAQARVQGLKPSYMLMALLPMVGLIYDNAVVGLGSFIGESDLLKNLNAVRYISHALLTPLLIIFAFGVARRAGVAWAQSRRVHIAFCLLSVAMIAVGGYMDIIRLSLEPTAEAGLIRYVNVGVKGPPIASIVTIIVVIIVGVFLWRQSKSPWLALGSVIMFFAAMIGVRVVGVANMGEISMVGGILSGEQVAQRR